MSYVDGFVLVVPTDKVEEYKAMAEIGKQVWMEHGALQYRECLADDMTAEFGLPFPKLANTSENETVIFSFIEYKSREHRDEVNAKVMADDRIKNSCDPDNMPFDASRMAYGGFRTIVSN